jgi:AbrB family looped-hinge helix DNA binding protein
MYDMTQASLTIAPNGRIVIPANMRAELGWQNGGKLLARLVNGTVVLEPVDAAIRRAQALVSQYVPKNAGIVDELIAERHIAAENE